MGFRFRRDNIFDINTTDQETISQFLALYSCNAHTSWDWLKFLGLWHRLRAMTKCIIINYFDFVTLNLFILDA